MSVQTRINYYRRIFRAYVTADGSQLTFWHETPEENPDVVVGELGPYYMSFWQKADYPGPFDEAGIPLLDYRGVLGPQYNPIAIAQYGLANYNRWHSTHQEMYRTRFLAVANWLLANLERNPQGLEVWNHHFDWDYRTPLKAPWYSALAQGQGISMLVRAHAETQDRRYLDAARRAFLSLTKTVDQGGVAFIDGRGNTWLEEYIVAPPTHILNGFLWALWGVYDFWLATHDAQAQQLFASCTQTLKENLASYDTGKWSLYEHSGTRMKMLASHFYHRLHIVQLRVTSRLTGEEEFHQTAERWLGYTRSAFNRNFALAQKSLFKLLYY